MDIFLSYSWSCDKIASIIESKVSEEPAFHVLRDVHSVNTAEPIHAFMNSIRTALCAVVILNRNYLYSENCVYELMEFSKERDFVSKIIPVEISGTNFFSKNVQREVIKYWKNEYQHNDSLPFDPNELSRKIAVISDLKCIVCDPIDEDSINACVQAVRGAIYQCVFQRELRTNPAEPLQVQLPLQSRLCIDFGTSYTLAAVMGMDGQLYMVRDCRGEVLCPSIIELYKDGSYAIGNAITTKMSNFNTFIVRELKRTILNADSSIYGSSQFSTMLLVAMFLYSVKRNAEEYFGTSFDELLLSIPVDFRWREIHLMKEAAKIAGLRIQRIIQESSTATMLVSFHAKKTEENFFLIIDFGGGTMDISAAEYSEGVCVIQFSLGDQKLGSVDYDHAIAEYIKTQLTKKYDIFPIYPHSTLYANILTQAEQVKRDLGTSERTVFSLEIPNRSGDITVYTEEITRGKYADITHDLTDRLKSMLERAKENTKEYLPAYLDLQIYLTGQGSKLFLVRELLQEVFPGIPLFDQYQESAVCQGLAIVGGILSRVVKNMLLLDNLHFYIDILCERYDEDEDIIYIGADNNMFHRIVNPEDGPHSIPTKEVFQIAVACLEERGTVEIKLYDYSPASGLHTLIDSQTIPIPPKDANMYILTIDVDVNSDISVDIVTEEEYIKMHKDWKS